MDNTQILEIGDTGRWQVVTETSSYELDLDNRVLTRFPETGAGDADPDDDRPLLVSTLRRDTEPIPLLDVVQVRVGESMMVLLDVRGDGISTLRRTTRVCTLTRVA